MLRKPRKRERALDALNHLGELDERYGRRVATATDAEELLLELGAPDTCYVMSDIREIDGQTMRLCDALGAIEEGGWGTILDCVPGKLGYYSGQHGEERLVLSRDAV